MRQSQIGIGKIVFLSLLFMSLGTLAIGFIAVFGIRSYSHEFDRLVAIDLPRADVSIKMNGAISGLSSQAVELALADSESAFGTVRIQIDDQIQAIDRLRQQVRNLGLMETDFSRIDDWLTDLTDNLVVLTGLIAQRIDVERARADLASRASRSSVPSGLQKKYLLFLRDLKEASLPVDFARLDAAFDRMARAGLPRGPRSLVARLIVTGREKTRVEKSIQGRLSRHAQLSSLLTDATRLSSATLNESANARSALIREKMRVSAYLILVGFLVFASIAISIFFYLDRNVVARIQRLTRQVDKYVGEGSKAGPKERLNEISMIETSFETLRNTIDEREARLVALNVAATEARAEAEEANRSKSELLAAASHDLRQPIHAMGLLLGGIDRDRIDGTDRDTIDRLASLTRETSQMFNSILDLSKLEVGTFAATSAPVDVDDLFRRMELEFAPRAASARTRVHIRRPPPDTFVLGDAEAIYRILSNLLVNALDYGREGTISVGCGRAEDGAFTFFVADQGPGLSVAPSPDAAPSTDQSVRHYGLGLSICFALTKAMKTELLHSQLEQGGTEFRFRLPAAEMPARMCASLAAMPNNELKRRNLILLEDDADVHSATRDLLGRLGSTVTACRSVREARQAVARQDAPFLLVTDFDLGRGNTTEELVKNTLERAEHLQGIIVTTADPGRLPATWHDEPAIHMLEKPFTINRLASLIRFVTRQADRKSPT
ncbi:hybrid sensor histidine kinase/response regulator [Stappia sp. 28M-7]|uniref:hybrid sensor histidine kinase/response regulator n=1 Tax=Stappia sp. 28M-7 TaxID=2762596 RepID=UPI00163BA3AE|nr:hybrid sensor histidine kinase/response regulator [Stappia sp. 28M-7]MBC2860956.1 hybrid sensor histidine kinase/response regulator [Stappia sp. 28M-7]